MSKLLATIATTAALALAGCGANVQSAGPSDATAAVNIAGHVHGGVFPIEGATIRLMETQSNGYGGAAVTLATTTSDQNGYFNFTYPSGGWTCPTGQYTYITVTSGYTVNLGTTTDNNDVIQVGVIGACSYLAASEVANVNVFVSELSTVAAAYALGNFITVNDSTPGQQIVNISAPANNNSTTPGCTGTGTAMSCTANGLGHAFTNAITLVDSVRYNGTFPTGQANQYNAAQPYYSSVPQQIINTIGNILQSCVDSVGGSSCGTLFSYTTAPSGATDTNCTGGTAPENTLEAVLNMARYPTCQITNRFTLQPTHEFFTPDLDAAPTSFTVSIFYGVGYSGDATPYPVDVALDAEDNAYILYGGNGGGSGNYGAVYGLSPSGSSLFTSHGLGTIEYPSQIATDAAGHIYVTDNEPTATNGAVYIASSSLGTLSEVAAVNNAAGIAVDRSNNVWVSAANTSSNSVFEYSESGMTAATGGSPASAIFKSKATANAVTGLAIDGSENIWGVSAGTSGTTNSIAFVVPNTSGSGVTPAYGTSGSAGTTQSLSAAVGAAVALTSSGEAYFPLAGQLDNATYSSISGITKNPSGTATTSGSNIPQRVAVDGAGNVFWGDLEYSGYIYEYNPSSGALISFLPCYPYPEGSGYQCITTSSSSGSIYTPSNLRAMAIDSAGDMWYVADAGYGAIIETLGLAQPAWPQLSYGHPGTKPQ